MNQFNLRAKVSCLASICLSTAVVSLSGCSRLQQAKVTADFALTVQMRTDVATSTHRLVYQKPHKWRNETSQALPMFTVTTVAVCDGKTLWTQMTPGDKCYKWDVNALLEENREEVVFSYLRGMSLIALPPANPKLERWTNEFGPAADWKEVRGEEHGGVLTTLLEYESKGGKIQAWFGKADGLLREAILYKASGEELGRFTVTDLAVAPKVLSSDFHFVPAKNATVIDETKQTLAAFRKKTAD